VQCGTHMSIKVTPMQATTMDGISGLPRKHRMK